MRKVDFSPADIVARATDQPSCVLDLEGRLRWASEGLAKLLACAPWEIPGTLWTDLTHPDQLAELEQAFQRLLQGEPLNGIEVRLRAQNGDHVWALVSAIRVHDEIHATAQDINARKRAELENEQKIVWLEMAEQLAQVGYWRVDKARGRVTWSDEVCRIHGVDLGAPDPTLEEALHWYHPEERDRVAALIESAVERRGEFSFESRIVRRDGEVRYVRSIGRCELDDAGAVCGIFGTFIDITDYRRLEESLRHRDRMATLGQMAGAMAHEINNPLTYILANVDYLHQIACDPSNAEETRELLGELEQGAEKIGEVVRDLQRLARRGRYGAAEVAPVDVASELETALRLSTLKLRGKARIVAHIKNLPPVAVEEGALIHVFGNLLNNAVQAIAAKGPGDHHIAVETSVEQGFVVVEIEDSGVGMSPEMQTQAFSPFVSSKAPGAGTGVGLTVAQQVVEGAQGRICLESREGVGTTVRVKLPVYSTENTDELC